MRQFDRQGVRVERTGWRDMEISNRHREWGFDCPAVDMDFLVVEYNLGKPVALIEYKHFKAREPNYQHATYRALAELANQHQAGSLPLLVAFYWPDLWAFKTRPLNKPAAAVFAINEILCERDYVARLYAMRNKVLTQTLEGKLNTSLPQEVAA
jgi:hypothetical protein